MTRATSVVGRTRSSISVLSEVTVSRHAPSAPCGRGALGHAPLAADHAADPADLLGQCLAPLGELVEGPVELDGHALAAHRQPEPEIAVAGRVQCNEELLQLGARDVRGGDAVGLSRSIRARAVPAAGRARALPCAGRDDDVALPRSTAATVPPEIAMSS